MPGLMQEAAAHNAVECGRAVHASAATRPGKARRLWRFLESNLEFILAMVYLASVGEGDCNFILPSLYWSGVGKGDVHIISWALVSVFLKLGLNLFSTYLPSTYTVHFPCVGKLEAHGLGKYV